MNSLQSERKSLLAVIILVFGLSSSLAAEQSVGPVSYNLNVRIESGPGNIAVQGSVEFENPGSHDFKFNLHETFTIKALRVNGRAASFNAATWRGKLAATTPN